MIYALIALVAHVSTAWRYGYFRDELYFIACSKHMAWGYVDQPPLVAFCAWLAAPVGYELVALRCLAAIAAALTVYLGSATARELGGGRFAQGAAALAITLLPAYLLLGNTLTTTSFEPLSWSLFLYASIRLINTGRGQYWMLAAAAFAFGMYGKYSMLLLASCALLSLLVTHRKLPALQCFVPAAALALLAIAPNLWWQAAHGWPFIEALRGDFAHRHAFEGGMTLEYTAMASNAGALVIEQVLYTSPLTSLLWITGLAALCFADELRPYRFIALTYGTVLVAAILLQAKGYYIIGIYAVLIAAGAVALERRAVAPARWAVLAAIAMVSLVFVPFALPVLSVDSLIAYSRTLRVTGNQGQTPRLIQPIFAEEFGWKQLAASVARVYNTFPAPDRTRIGVFADTYGDAGALDFYGPAFGLPPAISSQNNYYLWGPRGYDGKTLIVVGATQITRIRGLYRHVRLVATYANPYKWIVEGPAPIYVCTDPVQPLGAMWPKLRWYGA